MDGVLVLLAVAAGVLAFHVWRLYGRVRAAEERMAAIEELLGATPEHDPEATVLAWRWPARGGAAADPTEEGATPR